MKNARNQLGRRPVECAAKSGHLAGGPVARVAVVQIVDEGRVNWLYVQAAHAANTAAQISGVVGP